MKEFFLKIYNEIGLTGILFTITAITVLILTLINTKKLSEIEQIQRGIKEEMKWQRQESELKQQGRGTYN